MNVPVITTVDGRGWEL